MKTSRSLGARIALLLGISAAFLTGCSKDDKDDKGGKISPTGTDAVANPSRAELLGANRLLVLALDGKPLAKAQVLIGSQLNQPFENNFIETDADGTFVAPAAWVDEADVTLSAPGFLRVSYLKQKPTGQTFTLRPTDKPRNIELKGTQTGFKVVDHDGIADFGLVIPTLTKQDLFNFDMGLVISSQMDEITVIGQKVSMPSNVSLPKQKETYIFNITLDKPSYRMYFDSKGSKKIFSGRGQFPLKQVVDEMRAGKSFFELSNYFKINGGALKTIEIAADKNSAVLPVTELNFTETRSFQTPAIDKSQVITGVALSDDAGAMFPTDFKNAAGNSKVNLMTATGSTPLLLTVLKNKSETKDGPGSDRLSATVTPFENGVAPQMLAMMKDPQILNLTSIKTEVVNTINGVNPVGSYMLLSKVDERVVNELTVQTLTKMWEVYDRNWSPEYQLPLWPEDTLPKGKKRWEISRAGTLARTAEPISEGLDGNIQGKILDLGPGLFESVTHATHVSADF